MLPLKKYHPMAIGTNLRQIICMYYYWSDTH